MKIWALLFLILVLPQHSFAAVTINEIAWMGDTVSANNEWIELQNNGTDTDLAGWHLSDGANLNIELSGILSGSSYVLLERNRTSGVYIHTPPFLIYGGALVNTGATLTLTRSDGSIADRIAGGESWSIGGDNTTKETAQYTDKGWITAVPTPLRPNATTGTTPAGNTNTSTTSGSGVGSSGSATPQSSANKKIETVRFVLPAHSLRLALDIQKIGYVNQMIPFQVQSSGIGDTLSSSLKYDWNFGDLSTSTLKNPAHIYKYPGTYVVTLKAEYARQAEIVRHEITILPVTFSVTRNARGDIQINNDSPYEVDISGYSVVGTSGRVFPSRTILLPKNTITVPYQTVAPAPQTDVALYDTANQLVAATWQKNESPPKVKLLNIGASDRADSEPVSMSKLSPKPEVEMDPKETASFRFLSDSTTDIVDLNLVKSTETAKILSSTSVIMIPASKQSGSNIANSLFAPNSRGYVGLIGLLVLAIGAVFMSKNKRMTSD
jgi:PKD repeat protein